MHHAVGLIDVSTLGKILVTGRDAAAFLDRVYPNRFSDLRVGRIRYGVLTGDAGRIMDDGTVARLDDETLRDDHLDSQDGVYQWFTWWNAVWGLDARFVQLTGAVAAVNVAGPRSRELMQRISDDDFSNEGLAYLDAKHLRVAGVPCLALRIGFVGELGYELHRQSALRRARVGHAARARRSSTPRRSGWSPSGSCALPSRRAVRAASMAVLPPP